jgi:transposase
MTGSGPRAEVLTGPERRRRWSVDHCRGIGALGSSGAVVARRYGISTGLLYTWRRQARGLRARFRSLVPGFMPVVVAPEVDAVTAPEGSEVFAPVVAPAHGKGADMSAGGVMEIELSGGQRLRVDRHVGCGGSWRCWAGDRAPGAGDAGMAGRGPFGYAQGLDQPGTASPGGSGARCCATRTAAISSFFGAAEVT